MSRAKQRLNSIWTKTKGFMRDRNMFTFCFFLVFAAMIWFGHALNSVRERTLSICIEYTGVPDNIAFEQPLPDAYSFTVRDQGKRLQKYKESTFAPIVVDLSQQLTQKEGQIHISADQARGKIADQLQGTAKIQTVRPDVIEVNYYTQAKKTVPVVITGTPSPAAQHQFVGQPKASPASITIYGKKQMLDTISQVFTSSVDNQDIRDSLIRKISLIPIDGVRFSEDTVTVSVYTEQFTEKRLTVDITARGVPSGMKLRTFPSTAEVTIHIPLAYFNDITATDIQAVCRYPQTESNTLPLELKYSNPHILQARINPAEVEYIIEKQ